MNHKQLAAALIALAESLLKENVSDPHTTQDILSTINEALARRYRETEVRQMGDDSIRIEFLLPGKTFEVSVTRLS